MNARFRFLKGLFLLLLMASAGERLSLASVTVDLLGVGSFAGDAFDTSGFSGNLEDGTPKNRMGGFGSAFAYTGVDNRYVAVPDRGPADGLTSYVDRYYEINLVVQGGSVLPTLLNTTLLSNGSGQNYTGSSAAFDATNSTNSLRFDPEGVRVAHNGHLFISDEYGPFVYEFNKEGERVRTFDVPEKFKITNPSAAANDELPPGNTSGRQVNRGMEGLAISPDGSKLYGIMQNALIQDNALDASNGRVGLNNRILEIDIATGQTKEYVYQIASKSLGVNEIVAVNDHEFLVIERDGKAGSDAAVKNIYWIDITGATDVSAVASLPKGALPPGIVPVQKTLLLDMLDPEFNLAGAGFPEKIEGLAFGPDLFDGRHLLWILNDNDFSAVRSSNFYAFAINASALPNYEKQLFVPEPSTLLMFGGALAGLAFLRRKKTV